MVVQLWFVPCGYPIIDCGQQVWSDRNLALAPHMATRVAGSWFLPLLMCCFVMDAVAVRWMVVSLVAG